MSADLADLKRLKVTAETRAWLAATSRSTGKSQQEIARAAECEGVGARGATRGA